MRNITESPLSWEGGRLFRTATAVVSGAVLATLTACGEGTWNDPYPESQATANILYSSFEERPKHLDPVR